MIDDILKPEIESLLMTGRDGIIKAAMLLERDKEADHTIQATQLRVALNIIGSVYMQSEAAKRGDNFAAVTKIVDLTATDKP